MKYILGMGAPGVGLLHLNANIVKPRIHTTLCGLKVPKGWTETDSPGALPVCPKCAPPKK